MFASESREAVTVSMDLNEALCWLGFDEKGLHVIKGFMYIESHEKPKEHSASTVSDS